MSPAQDLRVLVVVEAPDEVGGVVPVGLPFLEPEARARDAVDEPWIASGREAITSSRATRTQDVVGPVLARVEEDPPAAELGLRREPPMEKASIAPASAARRRGVHLDDPRCPSFMPYLRTRNTMRRSSEKRLGTAIVRLEIRNVFTGPVLPHDDGAAVRCQIDDADADTLRLESDRHRGDDEEPPRICVRERPP